MSLFEFPDAPVSEPQPRPRSRRTRELYATTACPECGAHPGQACHDAVWYGGKSGRRAWTLVPHDRRVERAVAA